MSLPERLSSLGGGGSSGSSGGSKEDHHHPPSSSSSLPTSSQSAKLRDKDGGGGGGGDPPEGSAGLLQRCVIIQRDEKGYGFTVTGDNPVFVASVKPDGAAAKAGVQNNDRIVKVNGTLVTSRNHLDVVKLIKSGSYVALTLLGKPPATLSGATSPSIANPSIANHPVSNRDSLMNPGLVTAPQPVNADKDRELWQQKVVMTKTMQETAIEDYLKLMRQFTRNPSEKLQVQLMEKERTVKALGNQLNHLTGEEHTLFQPPMSPLVTTPLHPHQYHHHKPNRYSDSEHAGLEQFAAGGGHHQSWQSHHRTSSSPSSTSLLHHIKHAKQSSTPALMTAQDMRGGASSAAVARSKSDAAARKSKASSIFYVANQQASDSAEASSLPSATSDLSSMSDSPLTSPSISPTPTDAMMARHNGQDTEDVNMSNSSRQDIIHDEDEDMGSEEIQTNDPGPFADIKKLENEPAHMAVLLKYLISNMDPAPVLFHIISLAHSRCSASIKELRKWAYELYSTFIAQGCPLNIGLEDKENLINQIDSILTTSASRTDETALRAMFQPVRKSIQGVIGDLLADFCNKKDLGMGNFYGYQRLQSNMDKATACRIAEDILMSYLESVSVGSDEINSPVNDKDLATGWALATFLRLSGSSSKSSHSAVLEKIPTFLMKEKKVKFPISRSGRAKSVKNHQFTHQHFYVTTSCNRCGHLVWGVGYQGYQCQSCEMAVHKQCVDEVHEVCGGKKKRPRQQGNTRKPSTVSINSLASTQSQTSSEASSSLPSFVDGGPHSTTTPIPRDDDGQLASTLLFIAGIPTGHSVMSIVNRYESHSPPPSSSPMTASTTSSGGFDGLEVPPSSSSYSPSSSSSTPLAGVGNGVRNDRRSSTDLNRSGSLNHKGEKGDRRSRRAKSDVEMDSETFKAINQSGSSSTSSMSNRSGESPSTSTDNVHEQEELDQDVEPDLPNLKQVLGEDVLRKLKPKEKKRQEVINELMYTERAHLRNLRVLDKIFNQPMRGDIVMNDLAKALFPNLDEMITLHESITKNFKDRREEKPVVTNVGDILLKRFDGDSGESFRKGCAEYCRNQVHTLEFLKRQTRKEIKLAQFLSDAESKPVCRRLHLKDLVPCQMQRLTKYPLLIENLLKYTSSSSEEHKQLARAQERCKCILSYVNQAVKECENYHKLKEIEKRMDKKSMEAFINPASNAVGKDWKLSDKKLIFDGPLTWKLKQNRNIELHVLLLEDMLVLLQKQDDKYVLKCQNSNDRVTVQDENKYTHSPVLKLVNLLARDVATDEKAFFVVNISEIHAQMYELTASCKELRKQWGKLINDRAEELKRQERERPAGSGPHRPVSAMPARHNTMDSTTSAMGRQSLMADPERGSVVGQRSLDHVDGLMGSLNTLDRLKANDDDDLEDEGGLVQPEKVHVSNIVTSQATPIRTTLESLRHNSYVITTALEERDRLMVLLLESQHPQPSPPLPPLPPSLPTPPTPPPYNTTITTAAGATAENEEAVVAATAAAAVVVVVATTPSSSSLSPSPSFSSSSSSSSATTTTATTSMGLALPPASSNTSQPSSEWAQPASVEAPTHHPHPLHQATGAGNKEETEQLDVVGHSTTSHDDNNNLEQALLVQALAKVKEFTLMVLDAEDRAVMAQHPSHLHHHQHRYDGSGGINDDDDDNNDLLKLQQQQQQPPSPLQPPASPSVVVDPVSTTTTTTATTIPSSSTSSTPPASPTTTRRLSATTTPPMTLTEDQPPVSPAASPSKVKVAMPLDQLKEMTMEMNAIMAKLMDSVNNGKEEKKRLHQELKEARDRMDVLMEMKRQMILTGAVPPDRRLMMPEEEADTYQSQPVGLSSPPFPAPPPTTTTAIAPSLPPSSPSSSSSAPLSTQQQQQQQQQQQHSQQQPLEEEEERIAHHQLYQEATSPTSPTGRTEVVHHGIQEVSVEVVAAECVESLDSSHPSTQTAIEVAASSRTNPNPDLDLGTNPDLDPNPDPNTAGAGSNTGAAGRVIEIAMEEEEEEEDTNVSVADLPLPDMASVPLPVVEVERERGGVGGEGGGRGLLDNVELEESDEEDSQTVVAPSDDSVQALEEEEEMEQEQEEGVEEGRKRRRRRRGGDDNNDDIEEEEEEEEEFDDAEDSNPIEI